MSLKINECIFESDKAICRYINNIKRNDSRGIVSQDILGKLRNYVEHIMLRIYCDTENCKDLDVNYSNINTAKKYIFSKHKYKLFKNFYEFLQIVASHYILTDENSERLMLKYYEYLFQIKKKMKLHYDMELLENLEEFPLNTDSQSEEYYKLIAIEIEKSSELKDEKHGRYYIKDIKPFFINKNIYYEVIFSHISDYGNKTDRVIAFTNIQIEPNYCCKLKFKSTYIEIMGHKMPILIITSWKIQIRECEFENFMKLIEGNNNQKISKEETKILCLFMTKSRFNLLDIVLMDGIKYNAVKENITKKSKSKNFFNIMDVCRDIILNKRFGSNIIRYLLFTMNNTIIKEQLDKKKNKKISDLYMSNSVIMFESMPFVFSLRRHNPSITTLVNCFGINNHKEELFYKYIKNNTEEKGKIFLDKKCISSNFDSENLLKEYNLLLLNSIITEQYKNDNRLIEFKDKIYINKNLLDSQFIINELKKLSEEGIVNYSVTVNEWLNKEGNNIDCEEKKQILLNMFSNSKVSILYGAAGTGKTTLISYISRFFHNNRKLFLSQTNTAVDNLKRRITTSNSKFMTIKKFIYCDHVESDILIIDECSMVSNYDMKEILKKKSFKLLILAGDTYQIESIRFGNWFNLIEKDFNKKAVSKLEKGYRSDDNELINLWKKVRKMDKDILESLTKGKYSHRLDSSIFDIQDEDEIILCLNYDGLYGINNINRFLQENNPNELVYWDVQTFKIGDPIIFNDSERFSPTIYNNMKGKILNVRKFIDCKEERIEFDIELDKIINGMDVKEGEFELLNENIYKEAKNSVIRFNVYKNTDIDSDILKNKTIIPFQISYAVSIHKSQGLEYNSVKLVITNEVDSMITHNIFYTAITRSKSKLKIYWSPEVERNILSSFIPKKDNADINILNNLEL